MIEPEKPLRGLYITTEDRTLVRRPQTPWSTDGEWATDTGAVDTVLGSWLSCAGRPTTLTRTRPPSERTVEWRLIPGTNIPGVDLPEVVTGFRDDDGNIYPRDADVVADDQWSGLYQAVAETVEHDPFVWQVVCREVAFGADHPDLIDQLGWKADLGHIAWNDKSPRFDMWHPGYAGGVREWVFGELKALALPGVDVLSNISDPCVHIRQSIPGKTREAAQYTASGRRRKATVRVDAQRTVRLSLTGVPRHISGEDFLDACRKARTVLDELVAEIREVGTVCCPHCEGRGYTTTGKGS